MSDVIRVGEEVVGKAAVPGIAAELRLGAHSLPARQAILAMTTRRVELGDPDPVASFTIVTPDPTAATSPMPSWPGMNGSVGFTGQSPCAAWRSVWHTPQASVLTRIWPAPGEGMGHS